MDYKITRIEIKDEFKDCPSCGYRDGFHSMFKKEGISTRWLFICPQCHAVFDIGQTVPGSVTISAKRKEPDYRIDREKIDLRIDHNFISEWHHRYDEIAKDENEYRYLVSQTNTEISEKGTLAKQTFLRILNWKSPRVKGKFNLNEFGVYEEAIKAAHGAEEDMKLEILCRLQGIGAPVGSTILHFIYPGSFPIIDVRTTETLYHAGHIKKNSTNLSQYTTFRSEMLKLLRETSCFTLREIDRALFAYHKIYLAPKSHNKIQKKKNCHSVINLEAQMESFHEFTTRLSRDVGCYYHHTSKSPLYSLKKYDTDERGKMGVFGWVIEMKRSNSFRISTYWYLADIAGVADLADEIKDGMHYISKKNDAKEKGTGISIFVRNGSTDNDYQKAVIVLKAVMHNK